jgi:hypothetical protein
MVNSMQAARQDNSLQSALGQAAELSTDARIGTVTRVLADRITPFQPSLRLREFQAGDPAHARAWASLDVQKFVSVEQGQAKIS